MRKLRIKPIAVALLLAFAAGIFGTSYSGLFQARAAGALEVVSLSKLMDSPDHNTMYFNITFNKDIVDKSHIFLNRTASWPTAAPIGESAEDYNAVLNSITNSVMDDLYINGYPLRNFFTALGGDPSRAAVHANSADKKVLTVAVVHQAAELTEENGAPNFTSELIGDTRFPTGNNNTLEIKAGFRSMFGDATDSDIVYRYNSGCEAWVLDSPAAAFESVGITGVTQPVYAGGATSFNVLFDQTITELEYNHLQYPASGILAQMGSGPFDAYTLRSTSDLINYGIFDSVLQKVKLDGKSVSELLSGKGPVDVMVHFRSNYMIVTITDTAQMVDLTKTHNLTVGSGFRVPALRETKKDFSFDFDPLLNQWAATPVVFGETSVTGVTAPVYAGGETSFNILFDPDISALIYNHAQYPSSGIRAQAGTGPFDTYTAQTVDDFEAYGIFSSVLNKILLDGKSVSELLDGKGPVAVMVHINSSYLRVVISDAALAVDLTKTHLLTVESGFRTPAVLETKKDYTFEFKPQENSWSPYVAVPDFGEVTIKQVTPLTKAGSETSFRIEFNSTISDIDYNHLQYPSDSIRAQAGTGAFETYTTETVDAFKSYGIFGSVLNKIKFDGKSIAELLQNKSPVDVMAHIRGNFLLVIITDNALEVDLNQQHTLTVEAGFRTPRLRETKSDYQVLYNPRHQLWVLPSAPAAFTPAEVTAVSAPAEVNGETVFNILFNVNISDLNYNHLQYPVASLMAQSGTGPFDTFNNRKVSDFVNYGIFDSVLDKILLDGRSIAELLEGKGPVDIMAHFRGGFLEVHFNNAAMGVDFARQHTLEILEGFRTPLLKETSGKKSFTLTDGKWVDDHPKAFETEPLEVQGVTAPQTDAAGNYYFLIKFNKDITYKVLPHFNAEYSWLSAVNAEQNWYLDSDLQSMAQFGLQDSLLDHLIINRQSLRALMAKETEVTLSNLTIMVHMGYSTQNNMMMIMFHKDGANKLGAASDLKTVELTAGYTSIMGGKLEESAGYEFDGVSTWYKNAVPTDGYDKETDYYDDEADWIEPEERGDGEDNPVTGDLRFLFALPALAALCIVFREKRRTVKHV